MTSHRSALADRLDRNRSASPGDSVPFYNDPAAWVAGAIRWPAGRRPTDYQSEILSELVVRKRVSARGPHGLGKTAIMSWALLWFAVTRDAAGQDWKVPTTASVWRQLQKFLWPEVHKWAKLLDWTALGRKPFSRDELLALSLKLDHGEAFALASDDPTALEGVHADQVLYEFDESKAIPDDTFDAAEGAFSAAGAGRSGIDAYALAMSTPGAPLGRFWAIHSRQPGTEEWWARHVTVEEAIAAGQVGRPWVEARAQLWGRASGTFANRVLGEFASSDEDGVIPLAWVELANDRWRERYGDVAVERPGGIDNGTAKVVQPGQTLTSLGVDVARGGEDRSVLALCAGTDVLELRRYPHTLDLMPVVGYVKGVQDGHGRPKAIVDVIGMGGPVVDRLREMGLPVVGFGAGESATYVRRVGKTAGTAAAPILDASGELGFVNKRSAAWWAMREILDPASGLGPALPPDDRLTGDLVAPHWRVMSGGRIQVEAKDDIRKRIGRSTDDGDAVVMGLWDPRGSADAFMEAWGRMAEAPAPTKAPPQTAAARPPAQSLGRLSDLIRR